jgi:ABC-type sugar transport system permease subunit
MNLKSQSGQTVKKKKRSEILVNEERTAYAFLLPSLIGTLIFVMVPIFISLILGFTKWNPIKGLTDIEFVGLANFQRMVSDERVLTAIVNNIKYSIFYVPITIGLALLLAELLNKLVFGKIPLRTMIFMPYISSLASIAVVWMLLFYPSASGPINSILVNVFKIADPPKWFTSSKYAMTGIIAMSVWHDMGYYVVIILANMQGLSQEVYESAAMDGANKVQTFLKITIPMLKNTLFFCLTLATINSFKVFDQVNIITEGGPRFATTVLVQAIYHYAFKEFNFSYASAIAVVLFIMVFTVTYLQRRLEKKLSV